MKVIVMKQDESLYKHLIFTHLTSLPVLPLASGQQLQARAQRAFTLTATY
jgi:hypothetical protein